MPVRLLTLDCAGTLLRGAWDPVSFALRSAKETGLCLPEGDASVVYEDQLRRFMPEILRANLTGDVEAVFTTYVRLGRAWLEAIDRDPDDAPAVVETSRRLLTDPDSGLFRPFEDTLPFLLAARERGLRLAIASNWDATLPMVLHAHGLAALVDEAFASLVVGAEKPDPKMLRLAMASAGVPPEETVHIGDDPTDDLGAAANAGVRGLLLSRGPGSADPRSHTIASLIEVLDWID